MATLSTASFKEAITALRGTFRFNNNNESLNSVLISFDAAEEEITFTVTGIDTYRGVSIYLRIKIECRTRFDIKYPTLLIPYKSLTDILDNVIGKNLTLTCEEANLRVQSIELDTVIDGRTNDLPIIDILEGETPVGEISCMSRSEFKESIGACQGYASEQNPVQPLVTGIHILVDEGMGRAEATEGNILMRSKFPVKTAQGDTFSFTIPASFPKKLLTQKWKTTTIKLYRDRIIAIDDTGKIEFHCLTIQGLYPSYIIDSVIGKTMTSTVRSAQVNPHDLLKFLKKIDRSCKFVTLIYDDGDFYVHGVNLDATEEICLRRNGGGIGFAWANLAIELLVKVCSTIPISIESIVLYLGKSQKNDQSPVLVEYVKKECLYTVGMMQMEYRTGTPAYRFHEALMKTYSLKSQLQQEAQISILADDGDTIDVDPTEIFGNALEYYEYDED